MKPFVLAILLAGCAPYPYTYTSDCITFQSEVELDQSRVELYVAKAEEIFDARVGPGKLRRTLKNIEILVRKDPSWNDLFAGEILGHTSPFVIELSNDGSALVHEAYHALQLQSGRLDSGYHAHWAEFGYYEDDNEFAGWVFSANVWLKP
jgi:hypothetical protein